MATITGNQQLVKQINKGLVLETVKNEAPISRADISQMLGLNKGTVSSLISELIQEKLVYETGPGKSSGGRRPVMLLFNEKAGFSIGIDLGVNYILGVLTDLKGNIIVEMSKQNLDRTPDSIMDSIKSMIKGLITASPKSHYGIVGIGIGVPGLVNNEGEILIAPNLGWKNIKIKEEIESYFNIPVVVENEANAGAYGEKKFGIGDQRKNILYVSAGIGIGVGVILNGDLFTGTHGFSGEIGHTIIQVDGKPCSCGSRGCWELYASEKTLLEEAKNLSIPKDDLSIETLISHARNGRQDVIDIFNKIGKYLGVGVNNLVNGFNPEQIIIGNRLAMAKEWIEPAIKDFVNKHTMKYHQTDLEIVFSKHGTYSTSIGVSALSIENFLKQCVQ